jgi:hypothetical protein
MDDISDDGNNKQPPTRLSRLTVLLYLNDDFEGGETKFYQPLAERKSYDDVDYGESPPPPSVIASVRPVAGSLCLSKGVGEQPSTMPNNGQSTKERLLRQEVPNT